MISARERNLYARGKAESAFCEFYGVRFFFFLIVFLTFSHDTHMEIYTNHGLMHVGNCSMEDMSVSITMCLLACNVVV